MLVAQLCPTLCSPMDCSLPASSTGFSRQEYWSGLPFPSAGVLPYPGVKPISPVLEGGFFTTVLPGKPQDKFYLFHTSMWLSDYGQYLSLSEFFLCLQIGKKRGMVKAWEAGRCRQLLPRWHIRELSITKGHWGLEARNCGCKVYTPALLISFPSSPRQKALRIRGARRPNPRFSLKCNTTYSNSIGHLSQRKAQCSGV